MIDSTIPDHPHKQAKDFIYLFIYLFICLFIYLFIYLSIYLFIYLFVCLFVCACWRWLSIDNKEKNGECEYIGEGEFTLEGGIRPYEICVTFTSHHIFLITERNPERGLVTSFCVLETLLMIICMVPTIHGL